MKEVTVKITLLEEMLGTASGNPAVHEEFIASKAPDAKSLEEEVAAIGVEEMVDKTMTVFARNVDGNPILWDYQIKGMFKDACGMLRKVTGTESSKLKAYKKEIDGLIFVYPRQIPIKLAGEMGNCQRPLRAQTAQGERVALANSETVPAGSTMELKIECLVDNDMDAVMEWLKYGEKRGLGQWRNSSKGRFEFEVIS